MSIYRSDAAEKSRIDAELLRSASLFCAQAVGVIKNVENTLDFLAHELGRDQSSGRLKDLVDRGIVAMDTLVQIAHVDKYARTVSTHVGPDLKMTPLTDREHIRVHLDGLVNGVFIGKPVKGRVSGKWSIQITKKFNDRDGNLAGVIVASIDPFYFKRFWRENSGVRGVEVDLVGLDGVVRSSTADLQSLLDKGAKLDISPWQSEVFLDKKNYPEPRWVMLDAADAYPIAVVASIRKSQIDSLLAAQRGSILLIGAASTIVLFLLGVWLIVMARRLRTREQDAVLATNRLVEAINTMPDGFSLFGADGRLLMRNDGLDRLFPDVFNGGTAGGPITLASFAEAAPTILGRNCLDNGAPQEAIFQHCNRWVQLRWRNTHDRGVVAAWSDITELKDREAEATRTAEQLRLQAEQLAQLAKKAQLAGEAKSAFLAAMSHEIRTPLHAIMGFTDLLAKEADMKERESLLAIVRSSNKHLLSIVNDILDFSQIQAGQLVLERRDFELGGLVREIVKIARQLLTGSKVEFFTQYEISEPLWLNGDRRRLLQCILNLLSNAIKFTDDGCISLVVGVSGVIDGRRTLRIEVRDTGVGIAKESIATILEPFSKERGRVEASRSGTGLGLAITHELVSIMQGALHIESEPNKGSTFAISVKLAEAAKPSKQREVVTKDIQAAIPALRVLVAEDVESSRKYVGILLRQMGHEVIECVNGAEAVRAVAERDVDLVLMDVQMPVMDGLEATMAVRRMPSPKSGVYIAALTAQALEGETAQALDAGVDVVLSKPFRKCDLVRVIGQRFAGPETAGSQLTDA